MRASGVRLTILALAALVSTPATAADLPAAVAPVNPPPLSTPWSRFYLSLHGGVGLLQSTSLDYVNGALPSRSVDFNPGWTVVGAAGFQITPWWRTEIEVGGRGNGVRNISPGIGPGGSVQATTLMFNGYLDIPNQGPVTPYVGAGFGKAWISHSLTVDGATLTPGDNTSWPWAYQFMAGANIAIAPRWTAGVEYRFLGTERGLFQDAQGLFYNANYNNQSFLIGLTWRPL
jgi:opacity protein-like surface antigen